jgi:hypothetical protein
MKSNQVFIYFRKERWRGRGEWKSTSRNVIKTAKRCCSRPAPACVCASYQYSVTWNCAVLRLRPKLANALMQLQLKSAFMCSNERSFPTLPFNIAATMESHDPTVAPQHSRLLLLPTEIRHQVFQYLVPSQIHLRWLQSSYVFSECLRPPDGARDDILGGHVEMEMSNVYEDVGISSNDVDNAVFARRLQSSWGWHCKCEEVATRGKNARQNLRAAPMLVCKMM